MCVDVSNSFSQNVMNSFTAVAKRKSFRLFANVPVGESISYRDLLRHYDAVVLAYGAARDRLLNVDGEEGAGVVASRRFVGWYNGVPEDRQLEPDLERGDTVVIVGHGNVALDCARMLLTPVDRLAKTDITDYALDALSRSRVRRVIVAGRRGPAQVSFTIKELRELIRLNGSDTVFDAADFEAFRGVDLAAQFSRPRRRLIELMLNTVDAVSVERGDRRSWHLLFNRNPIGFERDGDGQLKAIRFALNRLLVRFCLAVKRVLEFPPRGDVFTKTPHATRTIRT